jgi:hypothetical protein
MNSNQRLRKEFLIERARTEAAVTPALQALLTCDPTTAIASLKHSRTSRRQTVRRLWDALPDESDAYSFKSIDELVASGSWCLAGLGDPTVTLHLGWDELCFLATLQAAWSAWPAFASSSVDAFNCCIYPESLEWYIVRAGTHLYPMEHDFRIICFDEAARSHLTVVRLTELTLSCAAGSRVPEPERRGGCRG